MKIKYKILKLIDKVIGREVCRCDRCGKRLTVEEEYYYDCYCEKCECEMYEEFEMRSTRDW